MIAYDHPTSDELAPAWEEPEPERDPLDVHPIEVPEPIAPPRPTGLCSRCRRPPVLWGHTLCDRCESSDRRAAREAKLAADAAACIEKATRELAQSPHRCRCGAHVLAEGQRCDGCDEKERDRRRRLGFVQETVSSLPPRHRDCHFGKPEVGQRVRDSAAINAAMAAAKNAKIDCIVFAGPPGAGKTTLAAAALCRMAYERAAGGLYVMAREISTARMRSKLGDEAELVASAQDAGILLIDDIGLDNPQQRDSAIIDLIYARHGAIAPVIVTLAIVPEQVAEMYGGGFARRLLDPTATSAFIEVHP